MIRVYVIVEPARMHRCEVCQEIFECHLCGILKTHPAHNLTGPNMTPGKVFVCEECCKVRDNRFQLRERQVVMDLLTGMVE